MHTALQLVSGLGMPLSMYAPCCRDTAGQERYHSLAPMYYRCEQRDTEPPGLLQTHLWLSI